jgi:predicted transcriptional regulator
MEDHINAAPADWLAALDESDADMAAGRIVSGESVMQELYASLARLEAKAKADTQPSAPLLR